MDKALEAQGFSPQSKEQKERILEAMELLKMLWPKVISLHTFEQLDLLLK